MSRPIPLRSHKVRPIYYPSLISHRRGPIKGPKKAGIETEAPGKDPETAEGPFSKGQQLGCHPASARDL